MHVCEQHPVADIQYHTKWLTVRLSYTAVCVCERVRLSLLSLTETVKSAFSLCLFCVSVCTSLRYTDGYHVSNNDKPK